MWPADTQVVLAPGVDWFYWYDWIDLSGLGDDAIGHGAFDCNRAVILCHPDSPLHPPACFIAKFPGATGAPLRITGSGRVSEDTFTTEPSQYRDEPVLVYTVNGVTKLMLAQELQSTGDDVFAILMQTGIQPAPGVDSHRLEAIEPLIRRGTGVHPGTKEMMVAPVTSNVLDATSGTLGIGVLIPSLDATSQPVKVPQGVYQTARWLGLQLLGANINCVFRYLGAILRGRRVS